MTTVFGSLLKRIQIKELINHRASKIQRNTTHLSRSMVLFSRSLIFLFYQLACKTIAFERKTLAFDYIQFLVGELDVVIDFTNSTDRT